MKDRYAYVALFDIADDGISISFPDLPGCLPCADTLEEAIENAREASDFISGDLKRTAKSCLCLRRLIR